MRLYLVQHGDAVSKESDPDRPLSDQGRQDVARLEEYLSSQDVQVAVIFHSGKTRAKETAEILEPLLEPNGRIGERQGLAPNDPPESFLAELGDGDILVVSHMPFVSRCVSLALVGTPDRQLLDFLPGTVAGIERGDDASWRLFMFVRPA